MLVGRVWLWSWWVEKLCRAVQALCRKVCGRWRVSVACPGSVPGALMRGVCVECVGVVQVAGWAGGARRSPVLA